MSGVLVNWHETHALLWMAYDLFQSGATLHSILTFTDEDLRVRGFNDAKKREKFLRWIGTPTVCDRPTDLGQLCKDLNAAEAFDLPLNPLADIAKRNFGATGTSEMRLSTLRAEFERDTGTSIETAFGRQLATRLKADARFHVDNDGRDPWVTYVEYLSERTTVEKIAHYNINGLHFADVPESVIGKIYHLANCCEVCPSCARRGKIWHGCTFCHHAEHSVYAYFHPCSEAPERQVVRKQSDTKDFKRRQQVVAKLATLRVTNEGALFEIARMLRQFE